MCFSTQASFVTGAVLLPLGVYGLTQSLRFDKRYLLFAMLPLIFAVQQLIEGMVWLKWHEYDYFGLYHAALEYTFIAFFLIPMYAPLSIYFIEPNRHRKKIMGIASIVGFLLGSIIYFPLLFGVKRMHVQVVNDSMSYHIEQDFYISYLYIFIYLIVTIFPMIYCSYKQIKIFGMLSLLSAMSAAFIFYYAFTSTWCFFAAILSAYAAWLGMGLKKIGTGK